ncbi:hypothetical protein ElyMa_006132400 [Elysia marginata]|uniref:Uncharacterized protein n=1 Tax=Elysia marginata TaxID=1093978 RepID=A0AAV4GYZ4_9GAST|nr:hypothetical protein ElyMa_006132400 [Elysia marginata]
MLWLYWRDGGILKKMSTTASLESPLGLSELRGRKTVDYQYGNLNGTFLATGKGRRRNLSALNLIVTNRLLLQLNLLRQQGKHS